MNKEQAIMLAHTPKTIVVNLRKDKYDVYIGRSRKGKDGYFGNPIVVGRKCVCGILHNTAGSTIDCFKRYFYDRLEKDTQFKEAVGLLKGLRLGCFCVDEYGKGLCHGKVIASYLDGVEYE